MKHTPPLSLALVLLSLCLGCRSTPGAIAVASPDPIQAATPATKAYKFVAKDSSCGNIGAQLGGDRDILKQILSLQDGDTAEKVQKNIIEPPTQPLTQYQEPQENKASIAWGGEVEGKQYEVRAEFLDNQLYARSVGVAVTAAKLCVWEVKPQAKD